MKLVDANVLLYAVNEADPKHVPSRSWLDGALNAGETVGFAWVSVLAFLRLSTKAGLFPRPLPVPSALAIVGAWLAHPAGVVPHPTARHLVVLSGILESAGTGANLVSDAHLAALALEYRATVVTFDSDFGRFPGVSWRRPGELT